MSWFRRRPHIKDIEKVQPRRDRDFTKKQLEETKDKFGASNHDSTGTENKNKKR